MLLLDGLPAKKHWPTKHLTRKRHPTAVVEGVELMWVLAAAMGTGVAPEIVAATEVEMAVAAGAVVEDGSLLN